MSINMQAEKTPMPTQAPDVRNHNFKEVALGYTEEQAINEAKRCLQCKKPLCVTAVLSGIPIPQFIAKSLKGDFRGTFDIISSANALPRASRAASALRKHSAKANASAASRMNRLPSVAWNVSLLTGPLNMQPISSCVDPQNGHIKPRSSAPAFGGSYLRAGELARKGFDVTVFEAFHGSGRCIELRHS